MPLYLNASHSSRIRKPGSKTPSVKRSSSSPFSTLPRRKPVQRRKSVGNEIHVAGEDESEKLDDTGQVISLAGISPVSNVLQAIKHSHGSMFSDVPERAGMNSTRIAEVLNFRRSLPSIVSLAHIHALLAASTRTEREVANLIAAGNIRKLSVSGRGNEVPGLGEFLVQTEDLEAKIQDSRLDSSTAGKLIELLHQQPRSSTVSVKSLSAGEITALRNAGFLVSSGISRKSSVATTAGNRLTPATISRQASGSVEAAGGEATFESLGGIGSARSNSCDLVPTGSGSELILSLPNTGVYLRLINDARAHLLHLLGKSKHKEAPLYLLRERWDGAVDSDNKVSNAKRVRGEYAGVLPGRTKKWKQLYGLNFDWVLEECLGAGLVELFDTGSVGHGIRVV